MTAGHGNGEVVTITCSGCGAAAKLRYSGDIGERMREETICFTCAFWQEMIEQDAGEPANVVIVDGRHYLVRPDLAPEKPKFLAGFGGARFSIRWHDGRTAVCHNLWHQGEIPEHFREQLPDNAVFETPERRSRR